MKSRNLLPWQLKSRNLLPWQMNLETSCLGKLLISWFNPQALTQLSGGSKSYDPELIPEGHSYNRNVNHSYKGSIGMVKVHLFSLQIYKWHLLNWQAAKTLWYCVASTLHFGYVKWLLFTRRVQTNDLVPYATSKPTKITRVKKYAHPKSDFVVRLVVSAPPPFKLKYSARNRVKRKW